MAKSFFKKLIVAINGNQSSIHAAMYAIMMARVYHLSVKFVYVVDTATIKYLTMNRFLLSEEKIDFEEKLKIDGTHYLDYVERLAVSKGLEVEKELRSGGVFTEIIKAAEEYDADLILLGGTEKDAARTDYRKPVLSRDQNEVLANSKCPVLIVQKDGIEAEFKIF